MYSGSLLIQPLGLSGLKILGHVFVKKMAMKRKRTCVSLEAKLEIINRLKKGESHSSLASE